jgi:Flp pilus assembly protein TadB
MAALCFSWTIKILLSFIIIENIRDSKFKIDVTAHSNRSPRSLPASMFLLVVAGTNGIPVVLLYVGSLGVIVIVVTVAMFVVLCQTLHRYRRRKRPRGPVRMSSNVDFEQ